jgi:hypothetical protein
MVLTGLYSNTQAQSADLGMFRPNWFEQDVLYIYENIAYYKPLDDHTPADSIVFSKQEQGGVSIISAPPYLMPEHLKLDYDVIWFRVVGVVGEFVEVEMNKETHRTAYLNRNAGEFEYWPDFLLHMSTVEPLKGNTLRIKPLDHAALHIGKYAYLHAVAVQGDWLQIELLDTDLNSNGTAWLRWRAADKLLVSWSLFM